MIDRTQRFLITTKCWNGSPPQSITNIFRPLQRQNANHHDLLVSQGLLWSSPGAPFALFGRSDERYEDILYASTPKC